MDFFTAIERLGLPIVAAALLIWHVLSLNKQLTDHNRKLLEEMGQLREIVNRSAQSSDGNERLLRQNEILVNVVQRSERASLELVRDLVQGVPGRSNLNIEDSHD
tara:strand:+ start:283 stop:597 length:315 start_codon:yes stop_codon:yes gene_type:complete